MALARLSVGVGKKGKAAPHAQYIAREEKYAKPKSSNEKLEAKGSGNMPDWAKSEPNFFWQSADAHERNNGSTYREHVIALPRELDQDQRHKLILDWIEQELSDKHAYQYAIHNPLALDNKEQPHCHLMFSDRIIDGIERDPDQYFKRYNTKNPEKGGAKKANTPQFYADRKADLLALRNRWETMCNKHLSNANSDARINMKSYKDRGFGHYKPHSLTRKELNDPLIKAAYVTHMHAKIEFISARDAWESIDTTAELRNQQQEALIRTADAPAPTPPKKAIRLSEPEPKEEKKQYTRQQLTPPKHMDAPWKIIESLERMHRFHDSLTTSIDRGNLSIQDLADACVQYDTELAYFNRELERELKMTYVSSKVDAVEEVLQESKKLYDNVFETIGGTIKESRPREINFKNSFADAVDQLEESKATIERLNNKAKQEQTSQTQPTYTAPSPPR